jgi:hypothetical protein
MTTRSRQTKFRGRAGQTLTVVLCVAMLALGDTASYARPALTQDGQSDQTAPKIPNDQLDSLVASIALYPDPLLAQVLAASTYPLEIVQLQQWMAQHKDLKGDALTAAVQKEDWDPSVQAMAAIPDAVKQLSENIKWTTDLGNAFLAQQADVMDAVQRMRVKAQSAGNLKSTEQQKVETKVIETKTVVVIEQANPQVVYVPTYNPVVVYGPPVYPYPPIVYPTPGAYVAGAAIAFGVGVAIGAAYHGGWGYNCGWGRNNVNININNNYVSHYNKTNINNVNRNNINNVNRNGNNNWQHNPQHRGGTPYSNKATASKYGGTTRGDSMSTRQANARQNQGANTRQTGANNRGNAGANRPTRERTAPTVARAIWPRTEAAAAGTTSATGKFRVTTHRGTRAPSEEHRVEPAPKRVVRGAHPAGAPPVEDAHIRAAVAGGNQSLNEGNTCDP